MTRVLHVVTGLHAGGAETQLLLLTRLTDTEPEVLSLTGGGSVAEQLSDEGVPVHLLGMRSSTDARALPRLVGVIRRGRYDAVHLHLFRSLVFGAPAARAAGVRTVLYTEHSLNDVLVEGRQLTRWIRLLYRATLPLVGQVVAVSDVVRARLRALGVADDRVRVVPNAVAPHPASADRSASRRELGLPGDVVVLGVVGRLVPAKHVDALLTAVGPLLGPDLRLLVVGEGSERTALEQQCADAGVASWVVFTGERSDVPDLLPAVDLLVSPSPEETFGLAVVEARLAGVPVIYVSCPALDELGAPDVGARCVGRGAQSLRQAVSRSLTAPLHRVPPPAQLSARYDARTASARLDRMYRGLPDTPVEL